MFTSFKINQNEINNTKNPQHTPIPHKGTHLCLGNLNQYTYRVLHLDIIIIILS